MYDVLLFIHLLGVALLVAAVATTVVATVRAQTVATVQELRFATGVTKKVDMVIGPAMVLILGAGMYMAFKGGDKTPVSWSDGWLVVALVIFLLMGVLGPTIESGHAQKLLAGAQKAPDGPVPPELDRMRRDPVVLYVSFFGASQIMALLFLMTNKPGYLGSVVACAIAAIISAVASALRMRAVEGRGVKPVVDPPAPAAPPAV